MNYSKSTKVLCECYVYIILYVFWMYGAYRANVSDPRRISVKCVSKLDAISEEM